MQDWQDEIPRKDLFKRNIQDPALSYDDDFMIGPS